MRRVGDDVVHPLPEYASLPPIPPAHAVDHRAYMGPTEESNWVLFPALLVGAYPSSLHDPTNTAILTSILGLGVTTFVCLQQEYLHDATEEEWRSERKLRPYIFDAIRLVDTLPAGFFRGGKVAGLEFVHFPIKGAWGGLAWGRAGAGLGWLVLCLRARTHTHTHQTPCTAPYHRADCGIAHDASVLQLARDLCGRLLRGEVMYLVRGLLLQAVPPTPSPPPAPRPAHTAPPNGPPQLTLRSHSHTCNPPPQAALLGWPRAHRHRGVPHAGHNVWPGAAAGHALGAVCARPARGAHGHGLPADRGAAAAGHSHPQHSAKAARHWL
jgi:hypothetical protein